MGGAVAKALAKAGARIFLTGRSSESVQKVADEILAAGGKAEVEVVDGFNEKAINDHIERIAKKAGTIDISFNAVGIEVKQSVPLTDLSMDEYVNPVTRTLQTEFLTMKAAAKLMMKQGSGVILTLTATPGGIGYPYTGGFAAACCALESLTRNMASEVGVYGVRVVNIRSGGSPDSRIFKEAMEQDPKTLGPVLEQIKQDTMLKQMPLMADIANTAVFLASDLAGKITGVTIDVTAGTTVALGYRTASL